MRIFRFPDSKFYWYDFMVDGIRYRRSTRLTDSRLAQRVADHFRSQLILKQAGIVDARKINEAITEYLNHIDQRLTGSYRVDTVRYIKWWREVLCDGPLDQISRRTLEIAIDGLKLKKCDRREDDTITASSVNRYIAAVRKMFATFVLWGWIDRNPATGMMLKESVGRTRILTWEEEAALLEKCKPPLLQLVIVALQTGARIGELAGLTWANNVDMHEKKITLFADQVKTREERYIPLNSIAVETLMSLPRGGTVFQFGRDWLGKCFHDAAEAAKLGAFTFHGLRHTVVSRLHAAGVPVKTVSLLVGHSSKGEGTTLEKYTHVQLEELKQAVDKLATLTNSSRQQGLSGAV